MTKVSLLKILKTLLLGLLLGAFFSFLIFFAKFYLQGKLPMGAKIAGVDVGLKTPEQAIQLINDKEREYLSAPLRFTLDDKKAEILPSEIGMDLLTEDTIATIKRMDFQQQNPFEVIKDAKKIQGTEILYTLDKDKLIAALTEKFNLSEIAPQNARYVIGARNRLEITEEKEGQSLETKTLMTDVGDMAAVMLNKEISLVLSPQKPAILKEELEKFREDFDDKLKKTITISYGKKNWTFKPLNSLDFIKFEEYNAVTLPYFGEIGFFGEEVQGATVKEIKITIDESKLNEFIDKEMVASIESEAEAVSIYKNDEGKIVIEGKGADGLKIQRGALKKSIELAINEKIQDITVQTRTIKAPVTISSELQEMGIKELVGVGHTSFYGSHTNRIHNINVGVTKINGTIIGQGETFSFNGTIGAVDDTTGYKKELVITKKGTIPEYGGGLCQVSTTIYRAAIFAGLPITERAPHSYVVSYYAQVLGDGLDATVYIGGQDLKFTNDTQAPILIHGYIDGSHAYFKFYGTSDGRSVSMDGPYKSNYRYPPREILYTEDPSVAPGTTTLVEKKNTGFDALWYRTIIRADGTFQKEEILSRYRAGQEKYLVAPGSKP